jgi:hypothetical protein
MELWTFRSTCSLDECEWSVSWLSCFISEVESPSCRLCEPRSHCGRQGQEKNVCLSRQLNPDSLSSYPADTELGQSLHMTGQGVKTYTWSLKIRGASWLPSRGCRRQWDRWLRLGCISWDVRWLFPVGRVQWVSEIMFITFRQQFVMLFCCVLTIETAATDRSLLH